MSVGKFEGYVESFEVSKLPSFRYDVSTTPTANGFLAPGHQTTSPDVPRTQDVAKSFDTEYYRQFIHIDKHPNGGASVVRMDQEEFKHLSSNQVLELSEMFFQETFTEEPHGVARHVMGIVHNAASYMPEIVNYLATCHPELVVKSGHLRKSEIETVKMEEYAARVEANYCRGTFRCGPLLQISMVGQVSEESGGYFPEFLGESRGVDVCHAREPGVRLQIQTCTW